ncbi:MAG TPA: DUF559 domain-containing protein [Ferruginibacter sp.]|nr:DUF559 domain-containing protein [Ferruginibacter sp.]
MISKLNVKAFQELVLYYLRERITHKNIEVKNLVATNINEWFIFDATLFDRLFAQNKNLVKQFNDFEAGRLADTKTDFFYKQIAEPFIDSITSEIEFTYFNIQDYLKPLRNADKADDSSLIALFKILSPEHLLKLPFTNDSNSLDKRFYSELLHIIGLTETKDGSKKLIERNKAGERHTGSILEDTIIQLDSLDKLNRLEKPHQFGSTQEERLFNVALELSITWINRILFLKLLEAQLITYHKGDKSFSFLNADKIKNYDDLNSLFFQVLARKHDERNEDVKKIFEKIPYLNSSLFEPTNIEQVTLFISNLKDDKTIPIFSQTVLKDQQGKKRSGNISTLQYLFEFLDAYDFGAEGGSAIQEDNKTLINASVLGLIFEKINGYKDGSFFTPGFITMYMCRETIRKAVVQKFNETKQWNCKNLEELYDKIEDRQEANRIVNSIKICDPAVGSGHFLVSALNEMIAVKNDLKILQDLDGKRLKEYQVEVVNDELIVTDEEGELFEYNPGSAGSPANSESQRVQETLFHEKQTIIENCLFGVDINSNSVKICRLRLWIELLKNAYYTKSSSPNVGEVSEGRRGPDTNQHEVSARFKGPNTKSSSPNVGEVSAGRRGPDTNQPEVSEGRRGPDTNQPEVSEGRRGPDTNQPEVSEGRRSYQQLNNLPYLKTFRKELRNNLTPAEAKLWTLLKSKQLDGRKFRRQHSFLNYILDFYCPEERIAIELDGQGHFEATQAEYDRERDFLLESYGIRVLRFENKWVWDNPEGILDCVRGYFGKQPPRQPQADTPPVSGGEFDEGQTQANNPPFTGGELGVAGNPHYKSGELDEGQIQADNPPFTGEELDVAGNPHYKTGELDEGQIQANNPPFTGGELGVAGNPHYKSGELDEGQIQADNPPFTGGELGVAGNRHYKSGVLDEGQIQAGKPPFTGGELGVAGNPHYKARELGESQTQGGAPPYRTGELRELQTLPNIDINIKCGNSLVSRFAIDADLKQALKKSKWTIDSYRLAVATYRNAASKEQKREMERLIADIKSDFRSEISLNDPKVKALQKLRGEWLKLTTTQSMFEMSKKEKDDWNKKVQKLTQETKKLETEIEEIKANKIFENAFEWRFEFPEVLNDDGDFVGFDVVIGNPPYIRQEEFKEIKSYLQLKYTCYDATADLYVYFVNLGLNLLKEKGNFIYIIPNKWIRASYGKKLRAFLLNRNIKSIIDFGDLPVFEEATTYPCIVELINSVPNSSFHFTSIQSLNLPDGLKTFVDHNKIEIRNHTLSDKGWNLSNQSNIKLIEKIKNNSILLKNFVNDAIFYGIKTGCNEAFILDEENRNLLIKKDKNAAQIIKPYLAGRDIKRYEQPLSKKYIILSERGINIENYPSVLEHLSQFKSKLEKKAGSGQWYELQASPGDTTKFEKPKIMYPDISKNLNFILDSHGHYSVNTVYNIGSDSKGLLGYLNSNVFLFYFQSVSNSIRGGYLRFFTEYIKECPIPKKLSVLEPIIDKILSIKKQNPSADTTDLENQIDQLVYRLYELTEEEIAIVEGGSK